MRIYKYTLLLTDEQIVVLPQKARILSVQNQYERVVLYALVTPGEIPKSRKVYIFGTGREISEYVARTCEFAGTAVLEDGAFVWHVFVGPEPRD